jgi:uncharacterized protein YxeA
MNQETLAGLIGILAFIVVIIGGIVTIINPHAEAFHEYVKDLTVLAGALGIGAGIQARK